MLTFLPAYLHRVQLSSDGQRPNIMAKENFVQVHVSFISKQVRTLHLVLFSALL